MNNVWLIVGIVVSSVLLWLMIYLASRWVISEDYANRKKGVLFLSALIIVILLPILGEFIGMVLQTIGDIIVDARNLITPSGVNYVVGLVPVINFLIFLAIMSYFGDMSWKQSLWVSLLGVFLLYCLYSFFPELNFIQFL